MSFQSYVFLFFFAVVLVLWRLLRRPDLRRLWLLCACLVFYGWSSLTALALLLAEGCFTWLMGRAISRSARKKPLLALGAAVLLAVLARFKYAGFFLDTVNGLTGASLSVAALALPLGLSFFTFQQLFYLHDCCTGELEPLRPMEFALWLCFFPTVSSGPITRPGELAAQFRDGERLRFSWDHFAPGLYAFSLGLFKKVILAEALAGGANNGFARAFQISSADAVLTILAYTFQLYFDFSGYCDMAWGLAKMLGIDLPRNFDAPYRAVSVSDFWARWHLTLTRFFRVCVYFPLGGNRKGLPRTCANIMIIFLLSGLWHGAGWTFVLWGALHGAAMVVERLLRGRVKLPPLLGWLLTFLFVNVAWVYFRAPSVAEANALLGAVFKFIPYLPSQSFCYSMLLPEVSTLIQALGKVLPGVSAVLLRAVPLLLFPLSLGLCLLVPDPIRQAEHFRPTKGKLAVCAVALVWSVVSFSGVTTFLYVNF